MSDAIEILYEEGPCFVLLKPAGLLTQSPPGIDGLEARFKDFLRQREGKTGNIYVGVPHRLDRPVSGAILMTRHVRACRRLSDQFQARTVRKVYWACLSGTVDAASGEWRDSLRKIPGEARAELVAPDHPDAREAILRFRRMGRSLHGDWLEIELETGRTHQIRVQCAARGLPILGDALYGATIPFGEQFADERLRAIALHGKSLGFAHPMNREPRTVEAATPNVWEELELQANQPDDLHDRNNSASGGQ